MVASILAVLGGFAATALFVVVTTAVAARAVPARAYLTVNLASAALAAFLGGFLTARFAPDKPFFHGIALAALMCVMGVLSARQAGDRQPRWYQVVLCTLMPAIALIGAFISGQVGGLY
jgi:MFS-type transporter involved in bile tolerance (Atg22 family)